MDANVPANAVTECYRLGKFTESNKYPSPILAKFHRPMDVLIMLSKISWLSRPIFIKPDLKSERIQEKILLQQRWHLIKSDCNKQDIRIKVIHVCQRKTLWQSS